MTGKRTRDDHPALTKAERRRLEEIENVHRALRQSIEFLNEERGRIVNRASARLHYEENRPGRTNRYRTGLREAIIEQQGRRHGNDDPHER